jgi:hypothetical protein
MIKLQFIDRIKFNQIDVSRQIITHQNPHKFALLDLGKKLGQYGINWNSEWIEPFSKLSLDNQIIWLGVEQKLVAICYHTGHILLALPLTAYLIQLLPLEKVTAALTEQEVYLFNPRGSIRYNKALPDLAIGMSSEGDNLVIQLSEGDNLILDPNTGRLDSYNSLFSILY